MSPSAALVAALLFSPLSAAAIDFTGKTVAMEIWQAAPTAGK
jgi:hypothetical protein